MIETVVKEKPYIIRFSFFCSFLMIERYLDGGNLYIDPCNHVLSGGMKPFIANAGGKQCLFQ